MSCPYCKESSNLCWINRVKYDVSEYEWRMVRREDGKSAECLCPIKGEPREPLAASVWSGRRYLENGGRVSLIVDCGLNWGIYEVMGDTLGLTSSHSSPTHLAEWLGRYGQFREWL